MKELLLVITSATLVTNIAYAGVLDMKPTLTKPKTAETHSSQYVKKPDLIITQFKKEAMVCPDVYPTTRTEAYVAKLKCAIIVTIKNNGGDAGSFRVALHYKDSKFYPSKRYKSVNAGLKKGASITVKFDPASVWWFRTDYKFVAEVDSSKTVNESNENNNLSQRKAF